MTFEDEGEALFLNQVRLMQPVSSKDSVQRQRPTSSVRPRPKQVRANASYTTSITFEGETVTKFETKLRQRLRLHSI